MSKILVGCDPEVFVQSLSGDPISIIGRLGGTKDQTKFFDGKHGVLEDNVAAEFNIPPADSADAFVQSINLCMAYINSEMAKQEATILRNVASVSFHPGELDCPEAWVFGCEPDFNAYTGEQNPRPESDDINLRSAGGHVHMGFGESSPEVVQNMVRSMDLHLGIQSVMLDGDSRRRELYGKAGAFRYKPYGGEYRTLSNFWVFSEDLIRWVYDRTQQAVAYGRTNFINPMGETAQMMQRCINTGDKGLAKELFQMYPQLSV